MSLFSYNLFAAPSYKDSSIARNFLPLHEEIILWNSHWLQNIIRQSVAIGVCLLLTAMAVSTQLITGIFSILIYHQKYLLHRDSTSIWVFVVNKTSPSTKNQESHLKFYQKIDNILCWTGIDASPSFCLQNRVAYYFSLSFTKRSQIPICCVLLRKIAI